MAKELTKRYLYERYAGACLSEDEYKMLEKNGIIPRNLATMFSGYYQEDSFKRDYLNGPFVSRIAKCGIKLFLEDWEGIICPPGSGLAAFVFDNFFVIVPEPASGNKGCFGKLRDILPVAIPNYKIKSVITRKCGTYIYNLDIEFCGGSSFSAYTGSVNYDFTNRLNVINHSFHVNQILLGLGEHKSNADSNQSLIEKRLKHLKGASIDDYDYRKKAVFSLFKETDDIVHLRQYIFADKEKFISELAMRVDKMESKDDEVLISRLYNINEEYKKIAEQKEKREIDKKEIRENIARLNSELATAGFFKKMNIKTEIYNLEVKLEELIKEKDSLNISAGMIDAAMWSLRSVNSHSKVKTTEEIPFAYHEAAKRVYQQCSLRNIDDINTKSEKDLFNLVCDSENVPADLRTKAFFYCGKDKVMAKNGNANEEKHERSRMYASIKYQNAKDNALIIGHIKYLKKAMEDAKKAEGMAEASRLLAAYATLQTQEKAVKSDSAFLGGLASGIGGLGAGIAAYANTEMENARAEAEARETRRQGYANLSAAQSFEGYYKGEALSLSRNAERIKAKLCALSDPEWYFSHLQCEVMSYSVPSDGTMTITVKVSETKKPEIGGMRMFVDGSLIIDIFENGKKVGDAYLCAEGFDDIFMRNVGFVGEKNYNVQGMSIKGEFDNQKEYSFEIRPCRLWLMEI